LHLHHHRRITICDTTDPAQIAAERKAKPKAVVPVGAGKGAMHIVVHAMYRGGLIHERTADGHYRRDSGALTAEVIYAAGKGGADLDRDTYHSKWNNRSFIRWIKKQLIPAFQKLFGLKVGIRLLLDNSKNHSRRSPEYVKVASPKYVLAELLERNGVYTFTVNRGDRVVPAVRAAPGRRGRPATAALPERVEADIRTFDSSQYTVNYPHGPRADELQKEVRDLYKAKPHLCSSLIEEIFRVGVCMRLHARCVLSKALNRMHCHCSVQIKPGVDPDCPAGFEGGLHSVVWTVPYVSLCNPIEFAWSIAKGHVASCNTAKQTLDTAKSALQTGLLGEQNVAGGVTADFAAKCFSHTKQLCSRWIHESEKLSALFAASPPQPNGLLSAAMREAYGAVPQAHRMQRTVKGKKLEVDDDGEDDGDEDDEGDGNEDDAAVVVNLAPIQAAAGAASA
jgi:hypothetical protein